MPRVATETCITCKFMDCVAVCVVDCFYVGRNVLVIQSDECIDCGVCEPECPEGAIVPDKDARAGERIERNRHHVAVCLNVNRKSQPLADARKGKSGKAALISLDPGT